MIVRKILFILLLGFTLSVQAESSLRVPMQPAQIASPTDLGKVDIEGFGAVALVAQKQGSQLIVHAQGPDGSVIGKAESVIGLRDTPIYVMTSQGLEKITIYWGSD